ncbi:hypothetical protein J2045_001957 [Peteryoungia aggregata LMG 23059]|uniref:Type VI secretion system spike protein VgrG3-like C-terminal domain-containing protein n=1 Tax=Peteryoungia aggregata LMG 23059 TaxID=1368425 RepID=A0ABU0G6F9_9HYPH|nr:serine protease [Peteryoungia aggregata]MDQ0420930.1 hypothetical protein [Peteryoungia aggregata LMG 23059]
MRLDTVCGAKLWLSACPSFVAGFLLSAPVVVLAQDPLAERSRQSVVFLKYDEMNPDTGEVKSKSGTGVIVSETGIVVTADHVVRQWVKQAAMKADPQTEKDTNPLLAFIGSIDARNPIKVDFLDGNEVSDLALLKLKSPEKYEFSGVCFLSSIKSGQTVLALGYPLGKDYTPLPGVLSNDNAPDGRWNANIDFVEGVSGGPVFDEKSEKVIGIAKGGLAQFYGDVPIPVTSVRYVTPIVRMRTMLTDLGVNEDCHGHNNDASNPSPPLDDKSIRQEELLRQQEELFSRLQLLLKLDQKPAKPFTIDTLARRYEGQTASNVGIDAAGTAYYGAFRIQAGPNLATFLNFLKFEKPDYAERLMRAGGLDAAKQRSEIFVREWQALAQNPVFDRLQVEFIVLADYARLIARLKRPIDPADGTKRGLGLDVSKRSVALQAVLFSIANQHGAGTSLPFDALGDLGNLDGQPDEAIIKQLYKVRSNVSFYYPDITSDKFKYLLTERNRRELEDALYMLDQ